MSMNEISGEAASAARDQETGAEAPMDRRATLKRLGRFALVTAPVVVLLLDANAKAGPVAPISGAGG
jgi:hypothetical protein